MRYVERKKFRWVRPRDSVLAGVCSGLAKGFGVEANLIRLIWALLVVAYGTGVLAYIVAALVLPREDRLSDYHQPKVLGVCYRLSQTTGWDLGTMRFIAVLLGLVSGGMVVILYIVLHFFLPKGT